MWSKILLTACLIPPTISFVVQISDGKIEGRILNATYSPFGNQSAIVFFGIPYVEPPLGDLRFRKPRPPVRWDGILETKAYKPACMSDSRKTYKNQVGGPISEDCLHLNLFTNAYCMENKNCAVTVIIHGGGYQYESASAFDPEILINNFVGQNRNIVVVTVNYRLGVFGFGHFNGDVEHQNLSLFDILEAVKWVRKEIAKYGGNKDRITLTGHSAGAAITAMFTMSPLTKGLINQQITMSMPFSQFSKQSNFKIMTAMARRVECLSEAREFGRLSKIEIDQTYSCLRTKEAKELLDAQLWLLQNSTYYLGAPSVDMEFVADYPAKLLAARSVIPISTMIGTTTAENRHTMYITDPNNAEKKEELLENMCDHIGYELYEEPEEFSEKCQLFYKNGSEAQFLSDGMEFYAPSIDVANAHSSNHTKVFLYSYAYTGAGAAFDKYTNRPSPFHSEDLIYVLGTHRGVFKPKDYIIERIYSGMFANFINFGDPSLSKHQPWLPYSPEKQEHFLIDFDRNFVMPGMRDHYHARELEFWMNFSNTGAKSYSEHWAPSLDTFIVSNLASPIVSHMTRTSTDFEKSLEQTDKLFVERETFLQELKAVRKLELAQKRIGIANGISFSAKERGQSLQIRDGGGAVEGEESGELNILLIIFAGTLVAGISYALIAPLCIHHRSRDGYQLLK